MSEISETGAQDLPIFDPFDGEIILSPEKEGQGYWVGAPAVTWDPDRNSFLMGYRRRRPREHVPDRGYTSVVAESSDGVNFKTLWSMEKAELDTTSIEKCCMLRCADGVYRYYLSYVDPSDQRWRIDLVECDSPENIDLAARREIFTAESASAAQDSPVEGVKDPMVYWIDGTYYMFISYAEGAPQDTENASLMHETSDVFNTGLLTSTSALATSSDGRNFQWQGNCLPVGGESSWDCYAARLGAIVRGKNAWYGYYDGSASYLDNYEEKTGFAASEDLHNWTKLTPSAPAITVPHASGSVRYACAVERGEELFVYYEMAQPNESHDLRLVRLPARAG
ncbi:MAG: hypothetical protein VX254_04195 [Planctomycetota bacterium]|nr:hypothetical protein [Planctomycetota bacterium]